MPALMIGSVEFPVAAGQIPIRYEDTAAYRVRGDGSMDMEVRGPFGRVRVWTPTSIPMDVATATTLVSTLLAAGTQTISGTTVGSATPEVYIRNPTRRRINMGTQREVVTVELHEVGS